MSKKVILRSVLIFILGVWFACMNDVMSKHLMLSLSASQMLFWRFLIGLICIASAIPLSYFFNKQWKSQYRASKDRGAGHKKLLALKIYNYSKEQLATKCLGMHILRGVIFAIGLACWNFGLLSIDLASAISISFAQPVIITALAGSLLNERVSLATYLLLVISLVGVLIVFNPLDINFSEKSLLLLAATLLWSFCEILAKKMLNNGETLSSIFLYSMIGSLLIIIPFSVQYIGVIPNASSLMILILYGMSGQLLILCYLFAMRDIEASKLMPLRYLEIVFAIPCGYFFFSEIPKMNCYWGALVIICAALLSVRLNVKSIDKMTILSEPE